MRLEELSEGSKVTIEVVKGNNKMEFKTEVRKAAAGYALTEVVVYNDHVLNFDTNGVKANFLFAEDNSGKLYYWKNCIIKNIVSGGNRYHMVISALDVPATNRREYYRVFVGLPATVRMGNDQQSYNVMVKDISEHGFAVVTDKEIDYSRNPMVLLVIDDNSLRVNIEGMVVRFCNTDNDMFLYGCKFDTENATIQRYIADKQREELKRNRKR